MTAIVFDQLQDIGYYARLAISYKKCYTYGRSNIAMIIQKRVAGSDEFVRVKLTEKEWDKILAPFSERSLERIFLLRLKYWLPAPLPPRFFLSRLDVVESINATWSDNGLGYRLVDHLVFDRGIGPKRFSHNRHLTRSF